MPESDDPAVDLVLYTNPRSRGRIALWMLEETGATYRTVLVDFETREHKSPAYVALNPMGKVPTLVHRGVVVTEVAAICAYLADAFPEAGLAPAITDPARGPYLRWMFFAAGCIEPATVDKMFPRVGEVRTGAIGYGTFEDTFRTVEGALSPGPFLLGERFTAADLLVASQLGWGMSTRVLEPNPAFTAYVARAQSRPAHRKLFPAG